MSVPIYVFRIGEEGASADELERLGAALDEAIARSGLEAEILVINGDIESIDKDELREMLDE